MDVPGGVDTEDDLLAVISYIEQNGVNVIDK